jgi:hypothetical protein
MKLDAEFASETFGPARKSFERLAQYLLGRFDLFAERMLPLAAMGPEESAVREYELCLDECLKKTIELVADDSDKGTVSIPEYKSFIANTQARLGARVQYWLSQALTQQVQDGQVEILPALQALVEQPPGSSTIPVATRWEDITIRFIDDWVIQVTIAGAVLQPCSFIEMGFEDRRTGNKPNLAWETLRELATQGGAIAAISQASNSKVRNWQKLEKRMQEIRQRLKRKYRLTEDPIPYANGAYRARFHLQLAEHT